MSLPTTRYEVASQGFDPSVAGVGSDMNGSQNVVGLRVPTLPTTSPANRYQFVCAAKHLSSKECVRVVALRTLVEIGVDTNAGVPPIYAVTKPVTTPDWCFSDSGPVYFSLRMHRWMPRIVPSNVLNTDSFAQTWSGGAPALLYSSATFPASHLDRNGHPDDYVTLTSYTPPWGQPAAGKPVGGFGDIRDVRSPWNDATKQAIDPVVVRGPGWLILWSFVWQTNPSTRAKITIPAAMPLPPGIPEEAFVSAYPNAVYWRVGGSIVLEQVDPYSARAA